LQRFDPLHADTSFGEKHLDHAEMFVVVVAGVLAHTFGADGYFHDSGLHDGAGAIHAGHDLDIERAAFGGGAGARGVADGVAFSVFDPEILGGADQAFGHVIADAAGERVIAGGTDFVRGPDDDASELGVRIFAACSYGAADVEVVLVPTGDFAHGDKDNARVWWPRGYCYNRAGIMNLKRGIACIIILVVFVGALMGQRRRKGKEVEEITQTLPVLPDPPAAVSAETERLVFRVAPLSAKGLLSQQVRDGLRALLKDARGTTYVKVRAFVAGTGDMRRVQTILSETFSEKRLPVPALSTIQGGALPGEGVQVALEAIGVQRKAVNPHGLAFISGQAADTGAKSVEQIQTALRGLGLEGKNVLSVSCFLSTLDNHSALRSGVAAAFPGAAASFVQMQRLPVRIPVECEAVAALNRPAAQRVQMVNPEGLTPSPNYSQVAVVGPGRIVVTGTQMGFGTEPADVRLAFDRLAKSLDTQQVSCKDVVYTHVYPVSNVAAERVRAVRFDYFDKARPPASTLLPFEGLPSLDASFGIDVIAVR
jgi:enamine deaminase RidA (YjgF/YER057c/UK114 family)